jgi:putative transcriptional regulator
MLKLKLKQVLLSQGRQHPIAWLQKNCNLGFKKAYNLVNNKQKSIAFEDLSKICIVLECTPDELFWWDDTKKKRLHEWHPIKAKLITPAKDSNWASRVEGLNPDRVEALKKYLLTLETEKMAEARKIFDEVQEREKEQKDNGQKHNEQREEEQDNDLDTALD